MTEIPLEPCTVHISFAAMDAKGLKEWGLIIGAFMEELAQQCAAQGSSLIGHIKGFTQLPGQGFMKASVIDTTHKAEITGNLEGETSALDMTLNVLVYGLGKNQVEALTHETISMPGQLWSHMVLKA